MNNKKPLLFLFILFLFMNISFGNNKPLIGILTLACDEDTQNCDDKSTTYLPASYVKWIQSGGGQVIPILSDSSHNSVKILLSKLNGVLFTGGDATFNSSYYYWNQILNIVSYLREYNHHNIDQAIPLWGTCLGLEAISCATAQNGTNEMGLNVTSNYIALPLNFTSNAKTSRIFNSTMNNVYSDQVYTVLSENNVTFNEHYWGFYSDTFYNDPYLNGNFSVISTSNDIYGKEFVSLMESRDNIGLYWYGSQFHPEKNQYEYAKNVPKSYNGTFIGQYLSTFFVNECRLRNNNIMNKNEYEMRVIYNYNPIYTALTDDNEYQQMYLFPKSNE